MYTLLFPTLGFLSWTLSLIIYSHLHAPLFYCTHLFVSGLNPPVELAGILWGSGSFSPFPFSYGWSNNLDDIQKQINRRKIRFEYRCIANSPKHGNSKDRETKCQFELRTGKETIYRWEKEQIWCTSSCRVIQKQQDMKNQISVWILPVCHT